MKKDSFSREDVVSHRGCSKESEEILAVIRQGESLTCEFKSDHGKGINDKIIYEEVVALANTQGGWLFIGVEDNGQISGARPRHGLCTDPLRLQSAISGNTEPSVLTQVTIVPVNNSAFIAIQVSTTQESCAMKSGKSLRRTIGPDGKPATVPNYPRDQISRRIDLGLVDFSANLVPHASLKDLDPLEIERARDVIHRLHGDKSLLQLSDEEFLKALGMIETVGNDLIPNLSAILFLGKAETLDQYIPSHGIFFQVIEGDGDVSLNDLFRKPLLSTLAEIEARFHARNEEREVLSGLFRIPIPNYSFEGFREALNNAIIHRDYSRTGECYVQWHPDHLLITSPGPFLEGISPQNILTHEPKPRNRRLMDIARRLGLVEQTGRGVDKIFLGQLRYGRPAPDYNRSDATGVRVVLLGGEASLSFCQFVAEQDEGGFALSLEHLLILTTLFNERRIDTEAAGRLIQKSTQEARMALETLHERGFVEARGERRGRVYHLAADLYRRFGGASAYVRSKGFDEEQRFQMLRNYVESEGKIARKNAADLCRITEPQAYYILKKMCDNGILEMHGQGRGVRYRIKSHEKTQKK